MPIAIHDALEHKLLNVSLHVDLRLPGWAPTGLWHRVDEAAFPSKLRDPFPTSNIVSMTLSCKIVEPSNREIFNRLVVSSKRLRSLQIATDFSFSAEHGKLPPLTTLVLSNWPYTPEHFNKVWDFSGLTHFDLASIDVGFFLQNVSPAMFPVLRELNILELSGSQDQQLVSTAAELAKFIGGLQFLEELGIKC